jgi:hypothetical protein
MSAGVAEDRYDRLVGKRQFYLDEGVLAAALTIPSICPNADDARNRQRTPAPLPKPWQSLGARGVRNLSAKLVMALLPVSGSFYRWSVNAKIMSEIEQAEDEEQKKIKTQLQKKLAARERAGMREVEAQGIRSKSDQAMRQLVVVGNVCLYLPPSGGMRVFQLNEYVCVRDYMGEVLELVVVEVLDKLTVPENVRKALDAADRAAFLNPEEAEDGSTDTTRDRKVVRLYTHIRRTSSKKFQMRQEVNGETVPGTEHTFMKEDLPWLPLRFAAIDGEDYGRGYIEEFRGELQTLEDLTKSIKIAALNAAKINPIINPNSTLTPRATASPWLGCRMTSRSSSRTSTQTCVWRRKPGTTSSKPSLLSSC